MGSAKLYPVHNTGSIDTGKSGFFYTTDQNAVFMPGIITSFLSEKSSIIKRAADSWGLLSIEEKVEYTRRADTLSMEAFHLFMYDYLCMSGLDFSGHILMKRKLMQ